MKIKALVFTLLFFSAVGLRAQSGTGLPGTTVSQQTPAPAPSGFPFTVTGNFSASTNNQIPNALQSTFEYNLNSRWSLRSDQIGLNSPSGTVITGAGGQWGLPANAIFGPKSPASFASIKVSVNGELGDVKAPGGGVSFAVLAGASIDYKISSFAFVRILSIEDTYSRGLTPHNQVFGNYNSVNVGMGIGFNF